MFLCLKIVYTVNQVLLQFYCSNILNSLYHHLIRSPFNYLLPLLGSINPSTTSSSHQAGYPTPLPTRGMLSYPLYLIIKNIQGAELPHQKYK